ncbi:hypothetical protein RB653_009062 [Dictyostelium firmibasis]|uniref:Phytanoyl-CoA dioxygenase n=1 Tax=Dictyostelium firmibasis TaxID=79012 RepID=A0AAN7Z0B0_9MYCE
MKELFLKEKERFLKDGYIIINDFFNEKEFEPIKREIENETNSLIKRLYSNGLIKTDYSLNDKLSVDMKLIEAEKEYLGTSILLHTEFASRLKRSFGEQLFQNCKLLDLVEVLLDSEEISGHPEWNLRSKTPNNKYFNVPWHQDSAYLEVGAENYKQITVWIPLVDINENNGPLQILPFSNQQNNDTKNNNNNNIIQEPLLNHKLQKILDPNFKDSWYLEIEEKELENYFKDYKSIIKTCSPLSIGSMVLFTNKTIHCSLPNLSNSVRWTIDIRFLNSNDPTGFNPIDQKDIENKMKLRSKNKNKIPIDYSIWSPQSTPILMSNNNNDNILEQKNNDDNLKNYSIEGPWFSRWQ